jgi:hypothetical protein
MIPLARCATANPCVHGSAEADAFTRASQSGDTSALLAGLIASIEARTCSEVWSNNARFSLTISDLLTGRGVRHLCKYPRMYSVIAGRWIAEQHRNSSTANVLSWRIHQTPDRTFSRYKTVTLSSSFARS